MRGTSQVTICTVAAIALAALLGSTPAFAGDQEMPVFIPELQPFVGTWKHIYRYKNKKDVPLYLVIKQENGRLRLRFQLPIRDRRTDSDWNGDIELDFQVNMRQIQEITYRPIPQPPSILTSETRRYTGSWKHKRHYTEAVYELTSNGKLQQRCISRRSSEDKEKLPCFAPFVYDRVSADTKWPD